MDHTDAIETGRYVQHSDGSWWVIGPNGWPIGADELAELHLDAVATLTAVSVDVIDVEPTSVRDTEIR